MTRSRVVWIDRSIVRFDVEPEQVRGEIVAAVDDRRMRFVVVAASSALVATLWIFARESSEGTVVAAIVSAAAAFLVALFLGYGWRLQLTTEGVYYSKRTRLFGPYVVLTSSPISQLGTVRHWRESRLAALQHALGTRGITMEVLAGAPS